ncbi:MAG: hypothetical protein KF729_09020 [Sandaracinaceae bacterium]|nr:hypothetical protein [Sandaracinaceae bacterium]
MTLRSLHPEGRRLVTPELADGRVERWSEQAWLPLTRELDRAIPLDAFDAAVDGALVEHPAHAPALDAWLAPRLHASLPLTRREAADPGIWRFLAVVRRPELARHRWENVSWAVTKQRYWSFGTRHTANVFARLYWVAELTREGASYALTERVLGRPALATPLFARGWSQHRPAVEAFVDVLGEAPGEDVERAAKLLSRHLALVPLELLDADELRTLLRRFARAGRQDP